MEITGFLPMLLRNTEMASPTSHRHLRDSQVSKMRLFSALCFSPATCLQDTWAALVGLGTWVSSIQNPARQHCATLWLGAGAINEAPWGCMGQACIACKQTPPQAVLVCGRSLSWGQKATPNRWLGIPYARWCGRHGFINEWYRGLWGPLQKNSPAGWSSGNAAVLLWKVETAHQSFRHLGNS